MARLPVIVTAAALAVFVVSSGAAQGRAAAHARTVVVKMVDKSPTEFHFEPAQLTVQRGDTVRFLQTGTTPHNVEFQNPPPGTALGAQLMGPFLMKAGETYDVVIDARFAGGEHRFVCTPHQTMGMTGTLTVAGAR